MQNWRNPNYHVISTISELESLVSLLKNTIDKNGIIAIDVETTGPLPKSGLDCYHAWLLGVSFAVDKHNGYYIPLAHMETDNKPYPNQLPLKVVADHLNPVLSSGGVYLGHNIKFDYKFLWRSGIYLFPQFWDTLIADGLASGMSKNSYKLKTIIHDYVDFGGTKHVSTFDEASGGDAEKVDPFSFSVYAIDDVIYLFYIYEELKPIVDDKFYDLLYKAELPIIGILAQTELNGIVVDVNLYKRLEVPLLEYRGKIEAHYQKAYGVNIRSSAEIGNYLYDAFPEINFKRTKPTKQYPLGQITTEKAAIEAIERRYPKTVYNGKEYYIYNSPKCDLPAKLFKFIRGILTYRTIETSLNKYIIKIPQICVEKHDNGTKIHKLHTTYKQTLNSGRLSSSPNVQNFTRDGGVADIRKGFMPPPNFVLVEGDYSSEELRMLAVVSGEKKMLRIFKENPIDADLHTETAKELFELETVTVEQRHTGKTINFVIIYGGTEYSVSKTLNCSLELARRHIDRYYEVYPDLARFKKESELYIRKNGYTSTYFGRRRYMPSYAVHDQYKYEGYIRALINHKIQGSCADLLKFKMVDVAKAVAGLSGDAESHIYNTVHDSIMLATKAPKVAAEVLKKNMELTIDGVFFPVDITVLSSFSKKDRIIL